MSAPLPHRSVLRAPHLLLPERARERRGLLRRPQRAGRRSTAASRRSRRRAWPGPGKVRVNKAGCLDRCRAARSPWSIPEAVWYTYVDAQRHRRDRRVAPEERQGGRAPADAAAPGPLSARMNAQTERLELAGAAGAHRGAARPAAKARRAASAVIAHPHPLFGGTMDNKVVQTLARAFVQCGWTARALQFPRRRRQRGRARRRPRRSARTCWPVVAAGRAARAAGAGRLFLRRLRRRRRRVQALWSARDVRNDRAGRHRRLALRVPALPPESHDRTLVVHGEQDDTVPLPRCWTGRGRSHFPLRWFPGASISFTDNCRS